MPLTATPADGPAIHAAALTRRFDEVIAVDHLDLDVRHGEIVGLLGANGAGKTTTIEMLTTLLPPTSGSARVAGFDVVRQAAEVRRHIGYVPQLLSADGALTGRENLVLSARLYDVPRRERGERIHEALEFMELTEVADALVRTYSGGMIRRLEAVGAPAELEARVGSGATLDDVFAQFAGGEIEHGGEFRDVRRTRSTAHRLA